MRALLVLLVLCTTGRAAAESAGYALIVTNNRSQASARPDLHYADDDGVQYRQLFGELLGLEHVTLLTELDAQSGALHPDLVVQRPTHENLTLAVRRLARQLHRARANGQEPTVYLVLAGHGDLDRGQGYVDLADGRFTARELDAVIAQLPAARIHLILDSCNSYFLINPRKPGGKRWSNPQTEPRDLLAKYPQLGAILSTSAEAVTYEWSELQSGVFSYEVRSGLRGAADVNGDGRITYAELSGFVREANRPVVNDLYRPKVFARSPAADAHSANAVIAELPSLSERRLLLGGERAHRLTVRDRYGVRLLDVHQEAGTALTLSLPPGHGLSAQQRVQLAERPEYVELALPERGEQHVDALEARPAERLGRGEPPLFGMLFSEPYGKEAFARAQREAVLPDEPPSGVTERDAERLSLHLSLMAHQAQYFRLSTAAALLLTGAIPTAALTYSVYRSNQHTGDWVANSGFGAGVVVSALSLGIAVYFLAAPWSEEGMYRDFAQQQRSTERDRSRAVLKYELALKRKADQGRGNRKLIAWIHLIGGGINAAQGGVMLGEDIVAGRSMRVGGIVALVGGLAQIAYAVYTMSTKTMLENTWAAYSRDPAVRQRNEE